MVYRKVINNLIVEKYRKKNKNTQKTHALHAIGPHKQQ
jgi:hypothetical protein